MRALLCLLSVSLITQNVFAWGNAGHEAVGILAEKSLSPAAKSSIQELLNKTEDLAQASLWPDTIKRTSGWSHTGPYHYVSIPNGQNYMDSLEDDTASKNETGDIVRALLKAEDTLRNTKASKASRTYALRFIVHFVGDLHQPLHAGIAEDRGGNSVEMQWYGRKTNLHAVWDVYLIDAFMNMGFKLLGNVTTTGKDKITGEEYLKNLRKPKAAEIAAWQDSYISTWIEESLEARAATYKKKDGSSDTYLENNIETVNESILRAGYRLGAWLDAIMTGKPFFTTEAKNIRTEIKQALGKTSDDMIVLVPTKGGSLLNVMVDHDHDCDH